MLQTRRPKWGGVCIWGLRVCLLIALCQLAVETTCPTNGMEQGGRPKPAVGGSHSRSVTPVQAISAATSCHAALRPGVGSPRAAYRPSLRATRVFTACGLALPPVAFITWPTNQPASFGFTLAFSTWAGLSAITWSMTASMAASSVT